MSELPSLLLVLRANAGEVYTATAGVSKAVAKMESESSASLSKSQKAWAGVGSVGKVATVATIGSAIAIGVATAKMAGDYQSKITLLHTAGGELAKNMTTVSNGILDMAVQTGTSTGQLAEGMYIVEKAAYRGSDGLKVLKAAAEGAKAENVDLGTATNALTSVMMSYGLKAKDAISTQNQLVAGAGLAKTTMAEYAGSLSTVLPVASAAGIQFSQVAGAIATLTQHGTSAQESTQELANTIRNLQAPNMVASKAMQQLGLDVTDVSTHLGSRGLTGTIDTIYNAIASKMGPGGLVFVDAMKKSKSASEDMQTMLAKMPASLAGASKQFMSGQMSMKDYQKEIKGLGGSGYAMGAQFLALSKQTQGFNQLITSGSPGAQTFTKYLKDIMGGATGMNTALMLGGHNMTYFKNATEEVSKAGQKGGKDISTWATTQKTFNVQMAQAGQAIQTTGIKLGTVLIPFIEQAVHAGGAFVSFLIQNPPLLITLASIIGGVLGLAILGYIAKLVVMGAQSVWTFAKMVAAGVAWATQMAVKFVMVSAKFAAFVAQQAAQGAMWLAKQVVVLAQAGVLWARYAAMLIAENGGIAAVLRKGVVAVAGWVGSQASSLAKSAALWVVAKARTVAAIVAQSAAMIAQKAVLIGGAVAMGVVTAAQWAWNVAMDANPIGIIILAIAALVATIIFLVTHWKQVTQFLQTTWKAVGSFFKTVGDAIASWWNGFWNGLTTLVSQVIGNVLNWIKGNWGLLLSLLIGPLGLAIQWVVNNWGAIVGFFQAVGSTLLSWWNGFWNGLASWVQQLFGPAVQWVISMWKALQLGLQVVGQVISAWWTGLWTGWTNTIRAIWSGITGFVSGAWHNLLAGIQEFGSVISGVWNSIWSGLGGIVSSAFNGVVGIVRGVMNSIIGAVNGVIDGINGATSVAGAIGIHVGKIGHIPSLDVGGPVPGAPGAPVLALNHGGEYMLSRRMLSGQQPIDPAVKQAVMANGSGGPSGGSSGGGGREGATVMVNVQSNASPQQIAQSIAWELWRLG